MIVTVFGATGAIGSHLVDALLADQHRVVAYARNAAKVPAHWGARVRLVIGEITDPQAVNSAVAGSDAVISALGPSMERTATGLPLVAGTEHILAAMVAHGVRRFIGHGTPSVTDPLERATLQSRMVGFAGKTLLPRAYQELVGMTALVMASDTEWTIVRFIRPTDGPLAGQVRAGFFGADRIGFSVSRRDVARFTVKQLSSPRYIGRAPAISA